MLVGYWSVLMSVPMPSKPRMADFALWATACESAFRPAGTLEAAHYNNRRDAIENIVDADPVAAYVRELMADRAQWTGSAARQPTEHRTRSPQPL